MEDHIVDLAQKGAEKGMGISPRMLKVKTSQVVKKMGIPTPFRAGVPGPDWFRGLQTRHPDLVIRRQEKLSHSRARMLNSSTVEKYFVELHRILTKNKLHNKPSQVFNMDETGVQLEHNPTSVLARKGTKAIPGRVSNSRENIIVVACVSADGNAMPPFVIAKGKTHKSLSQFKRDEAPEGSIFTYTEKAWINDSIGSEWFTKVFLNHCGDSRPVLLILDGHHSHESLDILEAAIKNDVNILCLPPHTTHYLQPLDRTVFGPLMKAYNRACTEYMAADPRNVVSKASWAKLLNEAWSSAVTTENIVSGFRACGIYPYNPAAIPQKAYQPSTSWTPQATSENPDVTITTAEGRSKEPSADTAPVNQVLIPLNQRVMLL